MFFWQARVYSSETQELPPEILLSPNIYLVGEEFRNLDNNWDLKTRQSFFLKAAQVFVNKKPDETNDDPNLVAKKQFSGGEQHIYYIQTHTQEPFFPLYIQRCTQVFLDISLSLLLIINSLRARFFYFFIRSYLE